MRRMKIQPWYGLIIPILLIVIWFGGQQTWAHSNSDLNSSPSLNAPRLVEYILVSNENWPRFQADVNARLAQGYSPVGGVAINDKGQPVQAMGR